MARQAWLFVALGTLFGVGLGYFVGSALQPAAGTSDGARLRQENAMLREKLHAGEQRWHQHAEDFVSQAGGSPVGAPLTSEPGEVSDGGPGANLAALTLDALGSLEGEEDEELRAFTQAKLLDQLQNDPQALQWALRELEQQAGSERAAELAAVLGMIADADIEARALAMARNGNLDQKLLGLELLDRLNIENPDTRQGVVDILRSEQRSEILAAALYALHPAVVAPAQASEVRAALRPLAGHAEVELRRRGLVALARWSSSSADLEPVVAGLADSSVDVRAGAAFALGQAPVKDGAARAALSATLADPDEDWVVRELAWHSLSSFPQDAASHQAWAAFAELRAGLGEAVSLPDFD